MSNTPPILCFDFETTGLEAAKNDPIQVAAVLLRGDDLEELAAMCAVMRPLRPENASAEALDVHGFSLDRLENALEPRAAFRILYLMTKITPTPPLLSGHNVDFDMKFLAAAEAAYGFELPRQAIAPFCTCTATRIHLEARGKTVNAKLGTVAEHYGIEFKAHDALGDVRATAEILRRIREEDPKLYARGLDGSMLSGLLDDAGDGAFVDSCRAQYQGKGWLSPKQIKGLVGAATQAVTA